MYSLLFSLINSNISWLCFSTKAAVAALKTRTQDKWIDITVFSNYMKYWVEFYLYYIFLGNLFFVLHFPGDEFFLRNKPPKHIYKRKCNFIYAMILLDIFHFNLIASNYISKTTTLCWWDITNFKYNLNSYLKPLNLDSHLVKLSIMLKYRSKLQVE